MNIKILGDRVLIRPDAVEETTKSGLFVTGDARHDEMVTGTVLSVGQFKKDIVLPPELREGAKVIFIKYAASVIDVDGEPAMVVRMDDLIAIKQ